MKRHKVDRFEECIWSVEADSFVLRFSDGGDGLFLDMPIGAAVNLLAVAEAARLRIEAGERPSKGPLPSQRVLRYTAQPSSVESNEVLMAVVLEDGSNPPTMRLNATDARRLASLLTSAAERPDPAKDH